MAIQQINDDTKFLEWKNTTNALVVGFGDTKDLTTTDKSSTVGAINELDSDIGNKSALTTDNSDNVVSAINEIDDDVGDLTSLTTGERSTLVSAINEIDDDVGNLNGLNTTNKSNLIVSINELDNEIGNLTSLTTTNKSNLVVSINELDGEIGDLSTLTTTDKTKLVNAVNELNTRVVPDIYFPNLDNGRFATETAITVTTFDTGMFGVFNSSTLTEGHKFINDNANNGGAGASMGADAISLTTFLGTKGRTDLVNGWEFFIMDLGGGAGTANSILENGSTYYPFIENGSIYLGAIGDVLTWSGYVKSIDATNALLIGNSDVTTYIDGIVQVSPYEMYDSDDWVHIVQTITLTKEYYNLFPAISGQSTSNARIALSCLYRSENHRAHLGVVI